MRKGHLAWDCGQPPGLKLTSRLWAIILNLFNLFETFVNAFITFIMEFKKTCMEKKASKVRAYEQQWEESIFKNKILHKAITR